MRFSPLSGLMIPVLVMNQAPLRAEQPDRLTTGADIIRMHKGGLKDETILEFLKTYNAAVTLKGGDLADMAAAGLSDGFIQQLLAYVKGQPAESKEPLPPDPPNETKERAPGEPRPRMGYDPPPPPNNDDPALYEDHPSTYYVGYPYDYWAFPLWFYAGFRIPFHDYHRGYYGRGWGPGWGHVVVGRGGFGHSRRR